MDTATDEGLRVDPAKVRAITEMPAPTDKAGVQRLLGLAQYLSKFLPHLISSRILISLRYYNLKEEVTLQCDASQSGLGAVLTQNGQPVAYASRALTPAETRYAQI